MDRDEWVAAIHAAMARPAESLFQHTPSIVGHSSHFLQQGTTGSNNNSGSSNSGLGHISSLSLPLPHRPRPFLKPAAILGLGLTASSSSSSSTSQQQQSQQQQSQQPHGKEIPSSASPYHQYQQTGSSEGAAAPFAHDIAKYCCIQTAIHKLSQVS